MIRQLLRIMCLLLWKIFIFPEVAVFRMVSGYFSDFWKQYNLLIRLRAPGPFQLPVIGNPWYLLKFFPSPRSIPLRLEFVAKDYEHIMEMTFFRNNMVILTSFEAIKELLFTNEFSGRYIFPFATHINHKYREERGVLTSNCNLWKESERFRKPSLQDLGFGQTISMDSVLREELKDLMSHLKSGAKANDGIITIDNTFALSTTNLAWAFIAGQRLPYANKSLQEMMTLNDKLTTVIDKVNTDLPLPIMHMWFSNLYLRLDECGEITTSLANLFMKMLRESRYHNSKRGELLEDAKPETFIEMMLEWQWQDSHNFLAASSAFGNENILIILVDLFQSVSKTISTILSYCILYLALHTEIQTNLQRDISDAFGNDQEITVEDVRRITSIQAFILETFRLANKGPLYFSRRLMKNYSYRGYTIPEATCVIFNSVTSLYNEDFWQDPAVFRPDRFIAEDGQTIVNAERVTVFKFGKALCVDEDLAWASIFFYVTTLLRNFTIRCVIQEPVAHLDEEKVIKGDFTMPPQPFNIRLKSRHQ